MVRSAGDGMEFEINQEANLKSSKASWQMPLKEPRPLATSTPSNKNRKGKQKIGQKSPQILIRNVKKPEITKELKEEIALDLQSHDPSKDFEEMKVKLGALEQTKQRLIEEKMKLSTQLGIQTQVCITDHYSIYLAQILVL